MSASRLEELAKRRMRWLTSASEPEMPLSLRLELTELCRAGAPETRYADRVFPVVSEDTTVPEILDDRNAEELRRVFG